MSANACPTIVLTGASGFIGRRVCRALVTRGQEHVVALARDPNRVRELPGWRADWRVQALNLESAIDADLIPRGSVVLHLAGATSRASSGRISDVNVHGTRKLLEAAAAAAATHFVFASSIAARFADARWYPYAASKRQAEELLTTGEVPYSIVRPTIVFGPGSTTQRALARLAVGLLPVVFGNGEVYVQPVHVDDVAALLTGVIDAPPASRAVLEVGGADRVTMVQLIADMRRSAGRAHRQPIRLPLTALRASLARLEPWFRTAMPLTAGQLAVFANDSDATPNALVRALLPNPLGIQAMLRERERDV